MADHTAPDYYDQVARESREEIERQDAAVAKKVWEIAERRCQILQRILEDEFGRALLRKADLFELYGLIHETAVAGAEAGKGVVIMAHHAEAQRSSRTILEAVMAGVELAERKSE